MSNIKVICCDIDGTLLRDDKSLPEENKLWISRAVKEKGVRFLIVSGRILSAINYFYNKIGVSGLASSLNGTYLTDENQIPLVSHTIPEELGKIIVSVKENNNSQMIWFKGNSWYSESRDSFIYKSKLPLYFQDCIIERPVTDCVNKYLFMSESKADLVRVEENIRNLLPNPEDLYFYPGKNFLEIMPGKINKGTVVDDLIRYLNLDRNQIMAIGDDINDVEMLSKSGVGVAMDNATDYVKGFADYITDSNENNGVATAIKKFIFD